MIDPGVDIATSTDDELIAAYVRQGISADDAADYVAALRSPDPRFPLD